VLLKLLTFLGTVPSINWCRYLDAVKARTVITTSGKATTIVPLLPRPEYLKELDRWMDEHQGIVAQLGQRYQLQEKRACRGTTSWFGWRRSQTLLGCALYDSEPELSTMEGAPSDTAC
jgi:hypothetical protein